MATSCLSLPSESNGSSSPRLSSISSEMRSKTDNLDRLIAEVDRETSARGGSVARSGSGGSGHGSTGSNGGSGREVKRYIRRRYTDSRHPTTELPDVRDELPSLQTAPIRKEKSKQNLSLQGISFLSNSYKSAARKPKENQPFTILKISWKSKPDPNMAIPFYKKKIKTSKWVIILKFIIRVKI